MALVVERYAAGVGGFWTAGEGARFEGCGLGFESVEAGEGHCGVGGFCKAGRGVSPWSLGLK